jgi:hypothetical protein
MWFGGHEATDEMKDEMTPMKVQNDGDGMVFLMGLL